MSAPPKSIYGLDLSQQELDSIMYPIHFRREEWVMMEPALYRGKWFDYRFMHPAAATCVYAHTFQEIYRRFYRSHIDFRAAEHVKVLAEPWHTGRAPEVSAIWRGRMFADALGMPYDVYLQFAFDSALRYWQRRHLPRPLQIYSNRVIEEVGARWADYQNGVLLLSEHPAYLVENYAGLPAQNDHHEWLFGQVERRGRSLEVLRTLVHERQLLPLQKVRARYGDEIGDLVANDQAA